MPLAVALIRTTPSYFTRSAANAELALRMVRPEELSRVLLAGPVNVSAAGRIAGGLRHLGLADSAARLEADLLAAGIAIKPQNPFEEPARLPVGAVLQSPTPAGSKPCGRGCGPTCSRIFRRRRAPSRMTSATCDA